MSAERLLILHQGGQPETGEIQQLVAMVEREAGIGMVGTRVSTYGADDPTELLAYALLLRLEGEGEVAPDPLRRTTTYTVEGPGGRRVVALVREDEINGWVRRTIPLHLEKVERTGFGVTRLPGWSRLVSEPALSFVANARDGTGRRFADVHVVVSLLPETLPQRIQQLMPGGYIRWVDGVFRDAGAPLGQIDVAHWLVCTDASARILHLAYFPATRGEDVLLPWDLLSPAEKRGHTYLA